MRSVINVLKEKLFKQQTATKLFTLFRLAWNSFSDADILRVYGFPKATPNSAKWYAYQNLSLINDLHNPASFA